jgi:hypothetical protein
MTPATKQTAATKTTFAVNRLDAGSAMSRANLARLFVPAGSGSILD